MTFQGRLAEKDACTCFQFGSNNSLTSAMVLARDSLQLELLLGRGVLQSPLQKQVRPDI